MMNKFVFVLILCAGGICHCTAQTTDTAKPAKVNTTHAYFIISAGTVINAYYKDKPLSIETIEDFNTYVQTNAKSLKDAQVIVTGKPKTGTFDEVLKILSHFRIKNVTKNISPN
jgi:hypothetical protein